MDKTLLFKGLANGARVPAKFQIIGMSTEAIKKSAYGNVGKWSLDVINHPTSGSGTIACTTAELTIIAKKLGLSNWKSLIPALNKGIVTVETNATFNKAGSKYKNDKGKQVPYEVDHLRFNVNDYVLFADAKVEAFIERQQDRLVETLEQEGITTAVAAGEVARRNALREAAGLGKEEDDKDGEI